VRRYLILLAAGSLVLVGVVAAANYLVDPYRIWRSPSLSRYEAARQVAPEYSHRAQLLQATLLQADMLFIGTSRTQVGMDPSHDGIRVATAFNLAMPGQKPGETRAILARLSGLGKTENVLWGLDYLVFGCSYLDASAKRLPKRTDRALVSLLFDLETFIATLRVARDKVLGSQLSRHVLRDGRMVLGSLAVVDGQGHRALSQKTERSVVIRLRDRRSSSGCGVTGTTDALESLRDVLSQSHAMSQKLQLAISPIHARQLETIRAAGNWQQFEDWKRALVRINAEEAARANAKPFPLWDFSGYTELTTEPFPPLGDTTTQMRWYWESSHYKKELGDLVLDRIFDYKHPDREVPKDFGILLTPENIEPHLTWIRAGRERWATQFPEDVREIAELARTAGIKPSLAASPAKNRQTPAAPPPTR
jgi:hypothetical protein